MGNNNNIIVAINTDFFILVCFGYMQ
jgi:hypothetical protein